MEEKLYYVEVMWNREFHWALVDVPPMPREQADGYAKTYLCMGDGASVKNVRLISESGDEIILCHNFGKTKPKGGLNDC